MLSFANLYILSGTNISVRWKFVDLFWMRSLILSDISKSYLLVCNLQQRQTVLFSATQTKKVFYTPMDFFWSLNI